MAVNIAQIFETPAPERDPYPVPELCRQGPAARAEARGRGVLGAALAEKIRVRCIDNGDCPINHRARIQSRPANFSFCRAGWDTCPFNHSGCSCSLSRFFTFLCGLVVFCSPGEMPQPGGVSGERRHPRQTGLGFSRHDSGGPSAPGRKPTRWLRISALGHPSHA